jgi:hypothetical protein
MTDEMEWKMIKEIPIDFMLRGIKIPSIFRRRF